MEAVCKCGKKVTLPTDDWGVNCSSCKDLLLCPIATEWKYCDTANDIHKVVATEEIVKSDGLFYVIDNKVVDIRTGQVVYGTIQVEGIVKERLEELTDVKKKLKRTELSLTTMDWKLQRKDRELEEVRPELDKTKKDIRDKDNALGVMRTTLAEKEAALSEALGMVQESASKITEKEAKFQAAEGRAKKLEKELSLLRQKENDKVAKTEKMAREIKEAAREMEELQEAFSTANDTLEDAAIITDFWRQQSIQNEQFLADQKNSFVEYKAKMEQEMEEQAKFHQDQMAQLQKNMEGQAKNQLAEQERTFLEKQDKVQQELDEAKEDIRDKDVALGGMRTTLAEKETALDEAFGKVKEMEKLAKHYKKKMTVQEKSFLEQKDSLQKRGDISATNADLKRQNEIYLKMIDKLTETVGSSKAKDSEKTMEKEKKGGRVVVGGCEMMEEEEEV